MRGEAREGDCEAVSERKEVARRGSHPWAGAQGHLEEEGEVSGTEALGQGGDRQVPHAWPGPTHVPGAPSLHLSLSLLCFTESDEQVQCVCISYVAGGNKSAKHVKRVLKYNLVSWGENSPFLSTSSASSNREEVSNVQVWGSAGGVGGDGNSDAVDR